MSRLRRHQKEIKEQQNKDKQAMRQRSKENIEQTKLDDRLKQHKITLQQRQQQATYEELQISTTFKQRTKHSIFE